MTAPTAARRSRALRVASLVLGPALLLLAASGCTYDTSDPAWPPASDVVPSEPDVSDWTAQPGVPGSGDDGEQGTGLGAEFLVLEERGPRGLALRVEPVAAAAPAADAVPPGDVYPLDEERTAALLDRLPPWPEDAVGPPAFAFPADSPPPPRTGDERAEVFPPPAHRAAPGEPADTELEVLRQSPEGEVELAANVTVAFSRPMVPLSSLDALTAAAATDGVPVELEPRPAGTWRWLDTRTLLFEPEAGRMPMATRYQLRVPAGTTGAGDAGAPVLAVERSWSFSTPPPRLIQAWPTGDATPLDPVLVLRFDQAVDPSDVLAAVSLRAGGAELPLRPATPQEVRADEAVHALLEDGAPLERLVLFKAAEPLPPATAVTLTVPAGTPSAEGPLVTAEDQSASFTTHGPLEVREAECGWSDDCRPSSPLRIEFSNPLDEQAFDPALVVVEPAPVEAVVSARSRGLYISGNKAPESTVTVSLSPEIRDVFGQTLGETAPLTFEVGSAPPQLWMTGQTFTVLDPYGRAEYAFYSRNHDALEVELFRVDPGHWSMPSQSQAQGNGDADFWTRLMSQDAAAPERVWSETLDLSAARNELVETRVDLTPALGESGFGHAILKVTPGPDGDDDGIRIDPVYRWIQRSDAAVDAFVDGQQLLAWVTTLRTGRPVEGVTVTLQPDGIEAVSNAEGLARLPLPDTSSGQRSLVARTGPYGSALLPEWGHAWFYRGGRSRWERTERVDELRWYVFDDRGMYRPGEQVHLKGWMRVLDEETGELGSVTRAVDTVVWRAVGPRGNALAEGELHVGPFGGFDLAFELPEGVHLGRAQVQFNAWEGQLPLEGTEHRHVFQVQEFRRPEYEVVVTSDEAPHLVGGAAEVDVEARYFAGGGLPGADVQWTVRPSPASYTPPGRDDFVFGAWTPWWRHGGRDGGDDGVDAPVALTAVTDPSGRAGLSLHFDAVHPPRPYGVSVEAAITDVNQQRWSDTTRLLVHPSELYVGLRNDTWFVRPQEPIELDMVVTGLDGEGVAGREVLFSLWRERWVQRRGEWVQQKSDLEQVTVRSEADVLPVPFGPRTSGRWTIRAEVQDDLERVNRTEMSLWVAGGIAPPARGLELERLTLIPDRDSYEPGVAARLLINAPFPDGEGLLTVRRDGVVDTRSFTFQGTSAVMGLTIEDTWAPEVQVQVDVVGMATRTDVGGGPSGLGPPLPRPAYAQGAITLKVPPLKRALHVDVTPREAELEPGGSTILDVAVTGADGEPQGTGEVALVVVDEAVLAVAGYDLRDPLAAFYRAAPPGVRERLLRSHVLLADLGQVGLGAPDLGGGDGIIEEPVAEFSTVADVAAAPPGMPRGRAMKEGGAEEAPVPLAERSDFDALAAFVPSLVLDAEGRASVELTLPDNLTRYRVMAVAVDRERRFGKGESQITARLPLMLRASPPRFLNYGDVFELPVVLQNGTDAALVVDLAARAGNAALVEGGGRSVRVPAYDRVEVRLSATTERPGTARFQLAAAAEGAAGDELSDAARVELPVWTPATREAFALHGQVDETPLDQPVAAPPDIVPGFGGLELTLSSTAVAALTDAFLYVLDYPYGCSEQIASRVLSVAALRDVLEAFAAEGLPEPAALDASMAADIARLAELQQADGGFAWWERSGRVSPYVSIHAALALGTAQQHGWEVPEDVLERSRRYLDGIEERIPAESSESARLALRAFALNVRAALGDAAPWEAAALLDDAGPLADGRLSLESLGRLLPVLAASESLRERTDEVLTHLLNRVTETAGAAHFVTAASEDDAFLLLHSDRRTDGVVLDGLISARPASDLIPKLVAGLMDHRTRGRWGNTQENAYILLALQRYFETYEASDPDFVARAWLGQGQALESAFVGRDADRRHVRIPMDVLAAAGTDRTADLVLAKDGPGRLYYRLGLRYAPADLFLTPREAGFAVERRYEAVDDPDDVQRLEDGTWLIKRGATVRVRVTLVAPASRSHVALTDPLPAGFEPLNPALAVTGSLPSDGGDGPVPMPVARGGGGPGWAGRPSGDGWWRHWFEHQNLRDDRVEVFASRLGAGVYAYEYVARATTPGSFMAPPARVEEMYAPETFGRGASARVVVE